MVKETDQQGFTLLELAIIILIAGLLAVPMFRMYETYLYEEKRRITKEHLETVKTELAIYKLKYGHYPCPADRALDRTDVNYGVELRDGDGSCALTKIGVGSCMGEVDTNSDRNTCRALGDGDAFPADGVRDPVLIGGVPFKTLQDTASEMVRPIGIMDSLDGWNNKLTYAVTESLTSSANYDDLRGAIAIRDEYGESTSGTNNDAHYAVISHGPDGRGAYTIDGTRVSLCASGAIGVPGSDIDPDTLPPGSAKLSDTPNCMSVSCGFVKALDNRESLTALHYDDFVTFGMAASIDLWDSVYDAAGNSTDNIQNLNSGFIGIHTDAPRHELDVNGDIRAATQIRTNKICDNPGNGEDPENCLNTEILTVSPLPIGDSTGLEGVDANNEPKSPGIKCANNRALKGISYGDEQCDVPEFKNNFKGRECGVVNGHQTVLIGIATDGTILCSDGG